MCDNEDNLEKMVKSIKAAGADFVLFGGMTMRDNQAIWFMKNIVREFPCLLSQYEYLYQWKYQADKDYSGTYIPKAKFFRKVNQEMFSLCEKYRLPYRIKRFIPDDFRKVNYLIAEKFLNEAYFKQMTGKIWTKTFWAGQNINNLKEDIKETNKQGRLRTIRNVDSEIESKIKNLIKVLK